MIKKTGARTHTELEEWINLPRELSMLCPFLRGFEAIQPKYLPTKAQLNQAEKFRKKLIQRYGSMYNIKNLEKTESRPILYLQVVHQSGELWLLCQRSEANKRKTLIL